MTTTTVTTDRQPDDLPPAGTGPSAPPASVAAERRRTQDILSIGARANVAQDTINAAIDTGQTVEAFRASVFDHLATLAEQGGARSSIRVTADDGDIRRRGMQDAIAAQMGGRPVAGGPGERFRGERLIDMAAEHIGFRGRIRTRADEDDIFQRAFHTTSDFPILFGGAINAALAVKYAAAPATYRQISARRNVRDFRPQSVVRPGDFPALQAVGQAGEIKFGTLGESGETIAVAPYAVQFKISRQMLLNDNMGAIEELLAGYASSVSIFEERLFYGVLLSNSGAGPTMGDGVAFFHASHGNLAGAGTAITNAALGAGRAAMRKQKGVPTTATANDGLELNIAPAFLLVGPDKETEAETVLASLAAAQASNVNVFAGKLAPIVSAQIAGNPWSLFADPTLSPALCHVMLDGYDAPRLRVENVFGAQGLSVQLEHDFGAGALDWRSAYRNPGA